LLLVGNCILLQSCQGRLVLLLQLSLLEHLLLQLLVQLLQLLKLSQLLRVLLQGGLQLGLLLGSLPVNLARGFCLRSLTGRDVGEGTARGNGETGHPLDS